jgi:hypothetical protein
VSVRVDGLCGFGLAGQVVVAGGDDGPAAAWPLWRRRAGSAPVNVVLRHGTCVRDSARLRV